MKKYTAWRKAWKLGRIEAVCYITKCIIIIILKTTTMETIKLIKTSLTKKPGTKTVWIKEETEARTISLDEYRKIIEAAPFFRRLGGSEHLERSYTSSGYMVTRLVSTSPDRMTRRVYDFHI